MPLLDAGARADILSAGENPTTSASTFLLRGLQIGEQLIIKNRSELSSFAPTSP